jgi:D-Tyr-tRNAtyr deacylase
MLSNTSAVLQRVKSAFITVDEHVISSIGEGLLVLVGVYKDSTKKEADSMVERILKAELWPEENSDNVSCRWVSKENYYVSSNRRFLRIHG